MTLSGWIWGPIPWADFMLSKENLVRNAYVSSGNVAQQVRALTYLPKDWDSSQSTHIAIHNNCHWSRGSGTLFWPCQHFMNVVYRQWRQNTHTHTHTQKGKSKGREGKRKEGKGRKKIFKICNYWDISYWGKKLTVV